ncbi:MAG: DUF4112 domain-containing protein [Myxococcota bacterium]|nr:DUF4112 domain-containing protein [Myxococcota bacterium]
MSTTGHPRVFHTPSGTATYQPEGAPAGTGTRTDPELDRVRQLATVLDRYLVDPILGLVIPGGGDIVGSLLGLYTVIIAIRRRMSPVIIARMLMNLGIDAVFGIVPLIGDLFDVGFKANQRNVALLEDRRHRGGRATARDWLMVVGAAVAFLAMMALSVYAIIALLRAIF